MFLKLLLGFILYGIISAKPFDDPVCGYASCPSTDPDALNIHIVPHSHDDVGWEKTVDQYFYQDVSSIISSVVTALRQNPDRRFVQVETAFFKMWWEGQPDSIRQELIKYVNNGQFEIINGAWSMNDEAGVHYQFTIDQYTLGLRYLEDTLGPCSRPTVGWQIDSFGHSREQASINAQMGFDSFYFARLDPRDKEKRMSSKSADFLWRGSSNLGNSSDLFGSVLYQHYSAPPGFCFDINCNDAPIIDDEESPDYNYKSRVTQFANYVKGQAAHYATNHLLVVMGDDFRYQAALNTYINIDLLIAGFDKFPQTYNDKPIKLYYSTPSCYTKAINEYSWENNLELNIKEDDFFPYADTTERLVVGYLTSRPASKRFVREGNILLQSVKQLAANNRDQYSDEKINYLKEIMGVLQHHDAITGTEVQEVADDYHRTLHKGIVLASERASEYLTILISGNDGEEDFEFYSCTMANMSSCEQAGGDSFTIAVYNPLSWTVNSPVSIPVNGKSWTILDPDDNEITYQITDPIIDFSYVNDVVISSDVLEFSANDIPPLGYKVYRIRKSSKAEKRIIKPRAKFGSDDTNFEIDDTSGLLRSVTMNNLTLDITQDFLYYKSDGSECWVFRPNGDPAQRIGDDKVTTQDISGDIFQGVRQDFGDLAKQIIKVYKDDPNYIEFDWIVGPISIDNGGREIISKFSSYLKSESTFYTDSNGREMLKRVRNFRPDYEYTNEQPISANYYPITSKIVIRDEGSGVEMAVLTDRCEGGGSIEDGSVELMVHRAISTDRFGLNEQQYEKGIIVRGKHWLIIGQKDGNGQKSISAIERNVAMRKFLPPWIFVTNKDISVRLNRLKYSALTRDLPENVQILTLEPWKDNVLLLRLEHILEKDEDENLSKAVDVDLTDLFQNIVVTDIQEVALAANIKIAEKVRLGWPGSTNKKLIKPVVRADGDPLVISLEPMQIKTFLITIG